MVKFESLKLGDLFHINATDMVVCKKMPDADEMGRYVYIDDDNNLITRYISHNREVRLADKDKKWLE